MIDVLDRPRRQVFIEAVVMEVAVENNREFGISSHIGYDPEFSGEKGLVVFGNPGPKGGSILDLTSAASLTGLAVQGPPIEISGVSLPSFGAVMRALASNNDVNVLSTPHILTTDNEQAEIVVGDNVPFVRDLSVAAAADSRWCWWFDRRSWAPANGQCPKARRRFNAKDYPTYQRCELCDSGNRPGCRRNLKV